MNEDTMPMDAMEDGVSAIQLDADIDFLNSWPRKFWDREQQNRQTKDQRAAFALKVRNGEDVEEAFHMNVDAPHRYKERNTLTLINAWAGLTRRDLMPPHQMWLEMANKKLPQELAPVAEDMRQLTWSMLTEQGFVFEDEMSKAFRLAVSGFGACVRPCIEEMADNFHGDTTLRPLLRTYAFEDFMLEFAAGDWRRSGACFRDRYSKRQLTELSKPLYDENGQKLRDAVFDHEAVELIFERGGKAEINSAVDTANRDRQGGSKDDGGTWFEALEYCGAVDVEGQDLPDDVIITSINGVCVRAIENPYPYRTWVFFNWKDGDDIYGESLGYELACKETVINRAKTYSEKARYNKIAGVLTYDANSHEDAAEIIQAGMASFMPGNILPGFMKLQDYNPDLSDVETIREQQIKAMKELAGVSEGALAGLPSPSVTATASQAAEQGSATRNHDDALHLAGPVNELVEIIYKLILDEFFADEMEREAIKALRLKPTVSVMGLSIAPYRITQLQSMAQFQTKDPREYEVMMAEELGVPEEKIARIFPPPQPAPQPMPAPEQEMQPGQMPMAVAS